MMTLSWRDACMHAYMHWEHLVSTIFLSLAASKIRDNRQLQDMLIIDLSKTRKNAVHVT